MQLLADIIFFADTATSDPDAVSNILGILFIIVALLIWWLWATYNKLVKYKVRIEEAWSDISVQLKRRFDLIDNIASSVRGYATHEKGVFDDVSKARSMAASGAGDTPAGAAKAEGFLQSTLKSLFAVSEAYPQLRANENFMHLQQELTNTEDKIQASRRFYNQGAREYNTIRESFPTNLLMRFAWFKKFAAAEFFDVQEDESVYKAPNIKF